MIMIPDKASLRQYFIGIDVAKAHLDIATMPGTSGLVTVLCRSLER